jgi:subtilisin family serine protease
MRLRIFKMGFILGVFLLSAFGISAQGSAKMETLASKSVITHLLNSAKIKRADSVLKDFMEEDATTTRVIVNLEEGGTVGGQRGLEKLNKRENVSNRIQDYVNQILQGFNPAQVQQTKSFSYMAGFSAQVTLEGLEALAEDPDVLSIEKDVLLYPNLAQGIPLMNASAARSSYSGEGLSVAICDTGIDYSHAALGGGGFPNSKVIGGYDTGIMTTIPWTCRGMEQPVPGFPQAASLLKGTILAVSPGGLNFMPLKSPRAVAAARTFRT